MSDPKDPTSADDVDTEGPGAAADPGTEAPGAAADAGTEAPGTGPSGAPSEEELRAGCRLRARAVDMVVSGTTTSGETPRCTMSFLYWGPSAVIHAMVSPPNRAGATLSG